MSQKTFEILQAQANRQIQLSARKLIKRAKSNLTRMLKDPSGKLQSHVGYKLKREDGDVIAIQMRMYRYGIIRQHGAGRGYKAAEVASSPRRRAPWITNAFNHVTPSLADQLKRIKGDDMVATFDREMNRGLGGNYRI
jgi:hypothetical protein